MKTKCIFSIFAKNCYCNKMPYNLKRGKVKSTIQYLEEHIDELIRRIACILMTLCKGNIQTSKLFCGNFIPNLSIVKYYERIKKYFECSPMVYIGSIIYLYRYIVISGDTVNYLNIHRIIFICCLISVKYWEDNVFGNKFYSQIGGINLRELNGLEISMLQTLQFKLDISTNQFHHCIQFILYHANSCFMCRKSIKKDGSL